MANNGFGHPIYDDGQEYTSAVTPVSSLINDAPGAYSGGIRNDAFGDNLTPGGSGGKNFRKRGYDSIAAVDPYTGAFIEDPHSAVYGSGGGDERRQCGEAVSEAMMIFTPASSRPIVHRAPPQGGNVVKRCQKPR